MRHNREVEPHAVLGLDPGASPEEVQRAYRELAKRFHPDRAGTSGGELMASINAAYDMLRDRLAAEPEEPEPAASAPATVRAGDWLAPGVRRILARELLAALERDEQVEHVLLTSTSDSHDVQLAVTDRRLLWLRDDAIMGRVRYLRYRDVAAVEARERGRFRRAGELRIRARNGRRVRFFDLRPDTLARLVPALATRTAGA